MPEKETTRLRRQRRRVVANLRTLEPQVAIYREKLDRIDARLRELDPELFIAPRHYKPNPVFTRQELPRLAMAIMREEGAPLPVGVIAVRALARKGVTAPGPGLRKLIRVRLQQYLGVQEKRGVVVKVGTGNATRRGLVKPS